MKKYFFILFFISSVASANISKCIIAERVSRNFTLEAVNGNLKDAFKMLAPGILSFKKFEKKVKAQFLILYGNEIYHSLSSNGLEHADCSKAANGRWRFQDQRVLLKFSKGIVNEALPIKVIVKQFKSHGWKVVNFTSTSI